MADDEDGDTPLGRWLDAERRLSSEPDREDPAAAAEPDIRPADSVDGRTARYFWGAVGLANVALAGVSVGLMLVGFRGDWRVGGALVLIGLVALAGTYRLHREFRAGDGDGPAGGDP